MSCTLSEEADRKVRAAGVALILQHARENVVLVGCGGLLTQPKCINDWDIEVYGTRFLVPTFVVPGQKDELIVGSNVIRPIIQKMKANTKYWELINSNYTGTDCEDFLQLLSCISRWSALVMPDKVGTVRLRKSVTLLPRKEYVVWGKLPPSALVSPGSTVVVEPTSARSTPKNIMVGRIITPMWGDRWVPMKVLNPTESPVTLRRNAKIADVFPCIAVEDLPITQDAGLADIDIEGCEVSDGWKRKLVELVLTYQDVFSRDKLDCDEVKDFVHRIHLTDDHPFRIPYCREPPAHYHKLREVLSDMEMKGIISKSTSEYASPLVMVWKKSGDLRICTDFRWLNAKTVKDAHPLPHQADCLAALGGNAFFSTMDLTFGFYNVPLHESDRRHTAFTTPLGPYEYNRLPQGLCNSPASFMQMMLSIFGDLNFSSLLCYLDGLLVFAPSEEEALKRLEIVFSRLRTSNQKLAQKKFHFLRRSRKVRSFLGMVMFYQHFIPGCSHIAKPLFALTAGQKRTKGCHGSRKPGTFRKLTREDWTPACEKAFEELKGALLSCAVLAHPDFERPFILSTDASMDGLGAVLSQVPAGEERARPIAFASKSLIHSQAKYPAHRLEFLALKWAVCNKFSHWLKGHQFTVWTDNNPLTYILTKPKLDACEQHWVSRLAPYCFEIKYVPGKLNIVADTLSREPFLRPLAQRLLSEPYFELLEQVKDVKDASVQDAFRLTCQPQSIHSAPPSAVLDVSLSTDDVSSLMSSLCEWECASRQRATSLAGHLTSTSPPDWDVSHALSHADLLSHQTGDPVISRVAHYVEQRFNRTLGNMLRSLPPRSKQKWPQMIQSMTFVYNCTAHKTTGFAPFYLMFGRVPRLPVDLMFRDVLHDNTICDYDTYVKSLMDDLRSAMLQAQEHSTMEQRHQSGQYNRNVKGLPLSLGDQVLLANKGVRGKRKLSDEWEPVVYTVVDLDPALHICRIRDKEGHERVVHRNLLLQVNFLPLETTLNNGAAHPAVTVFCQSVQSDGDAHRYYGLFCVV
ncbi:unnamed protein product [Oreochromis niloticus]|nr:unnamed protein product [Mustela putorius furo]